MGIGARLSYGLQAAYGRRRPFAAKARRRAWRALMLSARRPRGGGPADYLELTPAPRDAHEFSDLVGRVRCYLGDVDLPIYLPGPEFAADPSLVPYLDPALIKDPDWERQRPLGRPHVLVHRVTPRSTVRLVARRSGAASVVDKSLCLSSELEYWRVRDQVAWPNYPSADVSLHRLRESARGATTSFVLATGPSALAVDLERIDAEVRITCNSAVSDTKRLTAFRPTIIAFTDPVFHMGPCRYAAAFRKDLVRAIELFDPLVVCGSHWVSPLLTMHPELKDRLAVIPFAQGGPWRWPTDRDPSVRATESVLTNLMLPIALSLTDHVLVAGVDGRQPSENYFWKHGLQYSDELMQTVFDAHPAFFRDRDYEDYYERYCNEIEEFLQRAEAAGKTVVGAASSWIPAFRRRGAAEPPSR